MKRFALLLLLFLSFSPSALASSRLEGPVPAQLIRVIDGDTVEVEGERFTIRGAPVRDSLRLVWTAEARADADPG